MHTDIKSRKGRTQKQWNAQYRAKKTCLPKHPVFDQSRTKTKRVQIIHQEEDQSLPVFVRAYLLGSSQ